MDARSILWVDANGAEVITLVRTGAGAGGIQTAILAVSNADFAQWWESAVTANPAPAPAAATYLPASPAAVLLFQCADLTTVTVRVPAPKLSLFMADGLTVDATAAAALIAACIGSLANPAGSLATAYIGGYLSALPK